MARVLRCDQGDFDVVESTCAAPYWAEETGFLPPLSTADALEISAGFAGLWALAYGIKMARRTALLR